MELSNEQNEREGGGRAAFRKLSGRQKLRYIWDYEKLPLLGILAAAVIFGSLIVRQITKKNVLITAAMVDVRIGEDMEKILKDRYEEMQEGGSRDNEVRLYENLLAGTGSGEGETADGASYEYAYASAMKLLALMTDKALDVVFMDDSAYEQFSRNEYLMDLEDVTPLMPYAEQMSGRRDAVLVSGGILADQARFDGNVWIGIIQNTKRRDAAIKYLEYCLAG